VSLQADTLPDAPPPNTYYSSRSTLSRDVCKALMLEFKTRPIWSKDGICLRLGDSFSRVEIAKHLTCVAYRFSSGPWRNLWIRYAYDPRKDPSSREYQVLLYKPGKDTKAKLEGYIRDHYGNSPPEMPPDISFHRVPTKITTSYQLVDLAERHMHVADILGRSYVSKSPHKQTGWYSKTLFDRIKMFMDQTLSEQIASAVSKETPAPAHGVPLHNQTTPTQTRTTATVATSAPSKQQNPSGSGSGDGSESDDESESEMESDDELGPQSILESMVQQLR